MTKSSLQTILGANGQIATELAIELNKKYTSNLRLVSRNPKKVNDSDSLYPADLLDPEQASNAVAGSEVAYFTAGLPPDTKKWKNLFPTMLRNSLEACKKHGTKFVYFDNTYMYPQNDTLATESLSFAPVGEKGKVRASMASMVVEEMSRQQIPIVICRAPEFYGPGKTQSVTNAMALEPLKNDKQPRVPVRDDTLRTLIWTPDASRAMALIGNTPDAFGQTWHLPCDDHRLTYKQFMELACRAFGKEVRYSVLSKFMLYALGFAIKEVREIRELIPRYEQDNLFDSSAFKKRFPAFQVTTYQEGLAFIAEEFHRKK